jgi:hypothetical protein
MRWIFLLLLMGNLLLFVLIFQAEKEQDVTSGHAPVGQLDVMPVTKFEQLEDGFKSGTPVRPKPERIATGKQGVLCSTLGPLSARSHAQKLSSELAGFGLASSIREEKIKTIKDYWVIQTPEVTAGNEESDIARLRRAGITDISVIRDGEYEGGVSLGIYRNRTNAIKRRQQVDRFGLTAEIVERGDEHSVYWVDTNTDVEKALNERQIDSITSRYIPLSIGDIECQ